MGEIHFVDFVSSVKKADDTLGIEAEKILKNTLEYGIPKSPRSRFFIDWFIEKVWGREYTNLLMGNVTLLARRSFFPSHKRGTSIPLYIASSGFKTYTIENEHELLHFDLNYTGNINEVICVGKKQYGQVIESSLHPANLTYAAKNIAEKYNLSFESRFLRYVTQRGNQSQEEIDNALQRGILGVYQAQETLDKLLTKTQLEEREHIEKLIASVE